MTILDKVKTLIRGMHVQTRMFAEFERIVKTLPNITDMPDAEFVKFKEKIVAGFNDKLVLYTDRQAEIICSRLKEEDIDAAIAFMSSAAGKNIAKALPEIQQEVSALGVMAVKEMMEEMMNNIPGGEDDEFPSPIPGNPFPKPFVPTEEADTGPATEEDLFK